jgi:hypothetical protein
MGLKIFMCLPWSPKRRESEVVPSSTSCATASQCVDETISHVVGTDVSSIDGSIHRRHPAVRQTRALVVVVREPLGARRSAATTERRDVAFARLAAARMRTDAAGGGGGVRTIGLRIVARGDRVRSAAPLRDDEEERERACLTQRLHRRSLSTHRYRGVGVRSRTNAPSNEFVRRAVRPLPHARNAAENAVTELLVRPPRRSGVGHVHRCIEVDFRGRIRSTAADG